MEAEGSTTEYTRPIRGLRGGRTYQAWVCGNTYTGKRNIIVFFGLILFL